MIWSGKPTYVFTLYVFDSNRIGKFDPFLPFGEGHTNRSAIFILVYLLFLWFYYWKFSQLDLAIFVGVGLSWFLLPDLLNYLIKSNTKYSIDQNSVIFHHPIFGRTLVSRKRIVNIIVHPTRRNLHTLEIQYISDNSKIKSRFMINIYDHQKALHILKSHK